MDDLLATTVAAEADVNPVAGGGRSTLLHDELVELQVVYHPEEPTFAGGLVREVDVTSLTSHML